MRLLGAVAADGSGRDHGGGRGTGRAGAVRLGAAAGPPVVVSSERAYVVGFEDGYFYGQGWHITGEMGGVWTPPLKLVDGVWLSVDGDWVGPAERFTSGWGYTRMELPDTAGLRLERTDFAPDGRRAVLIGLRITNPGAGRTVRLGVKPPRS